MKYKDKQKLFDLMFYSIRSFLKLDIYDIGFNFSRETDDNGYMASLDKCDYTHFSANITFNNDIWIYLSEKDKIDKIILLLIHEMCHIFTSMGSKIFFDERDYLNKYIGDNLVIDLHNKMVWFEEQMTNVIDKVLFEQFKKTKEYKDIKKLFKKIK